MTDGEERPLTAEEVIASAKAAEEDSSAPTTKNRDRFVLALEVELSPLSLVGSCFISFSAGGAELWGVVVGEPQPGTYLCFVDSGLDGGKGQIIVPIEAMATQGDADEWRFYDTWDQMRQAYAEYETRREVE